MAMAVLAPGKKPDMSPGPWTCICVDGLFSNGAVIRLGNVAMPTPPLIVAWACEQVRHGGQCAGSAIHENLNGMEVEGAQL